VVSAPGSDIVYRLICDFAWDTILESRHRMQLIRVRSAGSLCGRRPAYVAYVADWRRRGRGDFEARVRVRIAGKCPKKPESNCKRVLSGYAHRRCMRRLSPELL